jgi:hypothetical protein
MYRCMESEITVKTFHRSACRCSLSAVSFVRRLKRRICPAAGARSTLRAGTDRTDNLERSCWSWTDLNAPTSPTEHEASVIGSDKWNSICCDRWIVIGSNKYDSIQFDSCIVIGLCKCDSIHCDICIVIGLCRCSSIYCNSCIVIGSDYVLRSSANLQFFLRIKKLLWHILGGAGKFWDRGRSTCTGHKGTAAVTSCLLRKWSVLLVLMKLYNVKQCDTIFMPSCVHHSRQNQTLPI